MDVVDFRSCNGKTRETTTGSGFASAHPKPCVQLRTRGSRCRFDKNLELSLHRHSNAFCTFGSQYPLCARSACRVAGAFTQRRCHSLQKSLLTALTALTTFRTLLQHYFCLLAYCVTRQNYTQQKRAGLAPHKTEHVDPISGTMTSTVPSTEFGCEVCMLCAETSEPLR